MKRISIVLGLLMALAIINPVSANKKGEFRLGLKMLPEFTRSVSSTNDSKLRFTFGGGLQIYKNFNFPVLGIETGVYIKNKKGEESTVSLGRVNANYLSLPLHLRINIWNFYATTGVSFDFKLSNSSSGSATGGVDFKAFSLGYDAIVGYEQTIASIIGLFVEARFNPTLTANEGLRSLKFQNFGLGLGVNFKIGRGGGKK